MCISGVLRTAFATLGLFALTAPIALAVPPYEGTAEPTANAQAPTDLPSAPADARSCPYKLLPGSHIKVHVCTAEQRGAHRLDRRARTNASAAIGAAVFSGGYAIAAPLPQVQ